MVLINSQFLKVFGDDVQERIDKKVNRFRTIHHDANPIRLDSGDVSLLLRGVVQRAEGLRHIQENIDYYMTNAAILRRSLSEARLKYWGSVNSPYLWVESPFIK